jgi:hypothetical protein
MSGATITIVGKASATMSNKDGGFSLHSVPVGRLSLLISYTGYETIILPNVVVNSGKEVVLSIDMQQAVVQLQNVVITSDKNKSKALNDMAIVSGRSISPEETNRYAGGFNDPSRILSNFAGVTNSQDGSNDIIIRGNSPKYVQWRLEGIQPTRIV